MKKSSLSLISQSYSSDEEEEVAAKKIKLTLPKSVKSMFSDKEEDLKPIENDPKFHKGRIRSFPHLRGNWATFVYAHINEDFCALQENLIMCTVQEVETELNKIDDPHLSLTKVLTLKHHWINDFVSSIRKKLNFEPFSASVSRLKTFVNEDKTRTFIGLCLESPKFKEMVQKLDETLNEFRLPTFYDPAQFHVSLLWTLGDKAEELQKVLDGVDLESLLQKCDTDAVWDIEEIKCKCGNKIFNFY